MCYRRLSTFLAALLLIILIGPSGCSDDPTDPEDNSTDPGSVPTIHVDDGGVGVVLDTRSIFKWGYEPQTAQLSFTDYADFDTILTIDPTTHYAILDIHAAQLTQEVLDDLADGTPVEVIISGPDKEVLAQHSEPDLIVDHSNTPLGLGTDLPFIPQPVILEEGMPYLMQIEGQDYLFAQGGSTYLWWVDDPYVSDDVTQQFYFHPVAGMESTYELTIHYIDEMLDIILSYETPHQILADHDHVGPPAQFTLVADAEGWVKFQEVESGEYLGLGTTYQGRYIIQLTADAPLRWRLISDNIAWSVVDRGTSFNQPIMPPAQLDFAYRGELQNCAPGELTDSVGTTEERSWEVSSGTTEGFQLFSSTEQTVEVEVGMSVTASIGADIPGVFEASGEVEFSTNISYSEAYTTSETTTQESTWSNSRSGSKTVSHSRDYVVPPYTAVLIRDAVKTVRDVRVPFTQVLRVQATTRDLSRTLTGEEIRSQMMFNFVGGAIQTVGADYVDVGLRGFSTIDQMFEATTYADEIEGVCD